MNDNTTQRPTLVLGGTGKIGRRVVERLTARGLPVRIGFPGRARSDGWILPWEDLVSARGRSEVPSLGCFGARVPASTVAA